MKKFFAQLRPMERRLAVGVLVVILLVLNWWFIWPHFSEWGNLHRQLESGRETLALYQKTITDSAKYGTLVANFENQGQFVPVEDQAINFQRTIQSQSLASGDSINSMGRPITHTNEFFIEQTLAIDVDGNDKQLVDFLFKLGSSASMIRVLDLELQPDQSKQRLNAHVQLMASYQKKPGAPAAPGKTKKSEANHATPLVLAAVEPKTFQPEPPDQP
jgi:Tfp pilus assembly protein PilO